MDRAAKRRAERQGRNTTPLTALWFSNSPWAGTGYGTQTKQVLPRFQRDGHHIAVSSNYGLQGMQTLWEGVPIYPMGLTGYGEDVVAANFAHWKKENPDGVPHVFVLFDAWVLKSPHWDQLPTSIWTMVDHQPVPPSVLQVLAKPNITPLAVTRFGQREIERAGVAAEYIPMALDTNVYKPTAKHEGKTGWDIMGFGENGADNFTVSIVNANKAGGAGSVHRKAWAENLLAFSIFAQNKTDVQLYVHTERFGNMGGLAMDPLLKAVGLKPHQFRFCNQYANHSGAYSNEMMAAIYTATDVLLAPTLGEGFGLTVLEAGCTGTRVIANNFSAQPELVSEDSWLTEGQPFWDGAQLAWFNTPNIPTIVDALEAAYRKGRSRSQQQIEHAKQYDADLVWQQHWRPYIDKVIKGETSAVDPVQQPRPRHWTHNADNVTPTVTIYVPTIGRQELPAMLASLAPQLTDRIEVVVSDNNPLGGSYPAVVAALADSPARVEYTRMRTDIGGNANILRGMESGRGEWLWMIGDDDTILPGAVDRILQAIDADDADRLILLSDKAPQDAAGLHGSAADIAAADPALLIAATLITANVVRRKALNVPLGRANLDTFYGQAWAMTGCERIAVLPEPAITVGADRAGEGATGLPFLDIWAELLQNGYGVDVPIEQATRWNFITAAKA